MQGEQVANTKDRPILFTAPMVRALLAGTKTQTRRALKPQPAARKGGATFPCRYGVSGDRLWVRETWRMANGSPIYRADADRSLGMDEYSDRHTWKPSIHMPRVASRITLELVEVHVEPLQDISEVDAEAEGCRDWAAEQDTPARDIPAGESRLIYRQLWEQINGAGSWDLNPWVWCLTFKRAAAG